MALTLPTVHLNGTSRNELQTAYEDAYRAVTSAIDHVREAAPNARDYYVQGPAAYSAAAAEHEARIRRLSDVAAELLTIHESIVDA